MKVKKIYACWIYVSDLKKSIRFYQNIGFELKFIEKDGAWAEFDTGETSFALLQRPDEFVSECKRLGLEYPSRFDNIYTLQNGLSRAYPLQGE